MIHAMQQIEIPRLTIPLSQLGNTIDAGVVLLLLGGTVLGAGGLELGEVIDYFFFRLRKRTRQRGQSGRPREWGVVIGSVADSSLPPRRPTAEGPAANQPTTEASEASRSSVRRSDDSDTPL
eukprot:scaffold1803_cov195-Alexandrium_tamarense.AAC.18